MARVRKGAKKTRALRVFFATDVHGSERCFRKFIAAAKVYEADVLLLGGDVAGKGLVPVYAENGWLTAEVRGESVTLPAAEEERLNEDINRLGFYPGSHGIGRGGSHRRGSRRRSIGSSVNRSSPRCSGGASSPTSASTRACAASSRPATMIPLEIDAVLRAARPDRMPRAGALRGSGRSCSRASETSRRRRGTPSASSPRRSLASGSRR